jgi:hypothetical protein
LPDGRASDGTRAWVLATCPREDDGRHPQQSFERLTPVATLLRLLHAAGFDLRLHLAAYDTHDDVLAELEAGRSEAERQRRDRQLQAWRQATPAKDVA